jgi:hypothetical protein
LKPTTSDKERVETQMLAKAPPIADSANMDPLLGAESKCQLRKIST